MNLNDLQIQHEKWLAHNFPHQQEHDALLGLIEEVGELAHAHLKAQQGIRGTLDELQAEARDAIGDIVIYLASYCNTNHYNLSGCVREAWEEVQKRDWKANPHDGS